MGNYMHNAFKSQCSVNFKQWLLVITTLQKSNLLSRIVVHAIEVGIPQDGALNSDAQHHGEELEHETGFEKGGDGGQTKGTAEQIDGSCVGRLGLGGE